MRRSRLRDAEGKVQVHVTTDPLFSAEECAEGRGMADAHAEATGGWSSIPAGRYEVHGGWVKDIPGVREWFDEALKTRLYPMLAKLFPNVADDTARLRARRRRGASRRRPDARRGAAGRL